MRRTVLLIAVGTLLIAACGGSTNSGPTTTNPPGTTAGPDVTLAPPDASTTTAAPPPDFATPDEAIAYLFDFDPANGSPDGIGAAIDAIGGHFPGSPIPAYLEFGSPEVVQALVKALGQPSAANVQILVAMGIYGPPSTDVDPQRRWDPVTRVGITTALETANLIHGPNAAVAMAIIQEFLAVELDGCDQGGCWEGAWYDVPRVITRVDGAADADEFTGTIEIRSSDGSREALPVTMEQVVGTWVTVEGFLAHGRPPALVVTSPPDGIYMMESIISIDGVSEEGAIVTVAGESSPAEFGQFFEVPIELANGRNEILVTARNDAGLETDVTLTLFYDPNVVVQVARIIAVGPTSITIDPVELLFGDEALAAAIAAGDVVEGETLADDWYVSNLEPEEIVLPAAETKAIMFDEDLETIIMNLDEFGDVMAAGNGDRFYGSLTDPFSLLVLGDNLVQIEQRFLPGYD